MSSRLRTGQRVLFIGDSITDSGRNRSDGGDMGTGFASLIAAWYSALYPDLNVHFINRGLSGNRVSDLLARWQRDCIDLQPDWVSILIGINDMLRHFDSGMITSENQFETDYRAILDLTRRNTQASIILCDPFLGLPEGVDPDWRDDLEPKIAIVQRLAHEYDTLHLPLDAIFSDVTKTRDPSFWLPDGVHPTPTGHALIAQHWLRLMGAIS